VEIGHNLLYIICQDLSADSESEKKSCRSVNLWRSYRHFNVENSAFFHYNSGKKGAREMISTFLDFFRRGLPTHKKNQLPRWSSSFRDIRRRSGR
jgi:hypothetical protein